MIAKKALECANSNEQREKALKSIKIWKKILEHNKEPGGL
jgi:hypothetical protein